MSEELELKTIYVQLVSIISKSQNTECVLHKNIPKKCKYLRKTQYGYYCDNSIAQVQSITKHLKHIGLDISGDGFNAGIYRDIKAEVSRAKTLHENKDYTGGLAGRIVFEVGEVAHEVDTMRETGEPMLDNYGIELTQVAATCVRAYQDWKNKPC